LSEIGSINRQPMKGIRFFKLPLSMQAKPAGIGAGWPDFGNPYSQKEESDSRPYSFGRHFTKNCGIVSKQYDIVSKQYGIVSKLYDIVLKQCDIVSKQYDIVLKQYNIVSKQYDIVLKQYGIVSKQYDIILKQYGIVSKQCGIILSFYDRFWPSPMAFQWNTPSLNPLVDGAFRQSGALHTSFSGGSITNATTRQRPSTPFLNPKASLTLTI